MLILIRLIIPHNEKQHFGCRILNDAVEIRYYDNNTTREKYHLLKIKGVKYFDHFPLEYTNITSAPLTLMNDD